MGAWTAYAAVLWAGPATGVGLTGPEEFRSLWPLEYLSLSRPGSGQRRNRGHLPGRVRRDEGCPGLPQVGGEFLGSRSADTIQGDDPPRSSPGRGGCVARRDCPPGRVPVLIPCWR